MTSYNIAFQAGHKRYARLLADQGVSGNILPDLPVEGCGGWVSIGEAHAIDFHEASDTGHRSKGTA